MNKNVSLSVDEWVEKIINEVPNDRDLALYNPNSHELKIQSGDGESIEVKIECRVGEPCLLILLEEATSAALYERLSQFIGRQSSPILLIDTIYELLAASSSFKEMLSVFDEEDIALVMHFGNKRWCTIARRSFCEVPNLKFLFNQTHIVVLWNDDNHKPFMMTLRDEADAARFVRTLRNRRRKTNELYCSIKERIEAFKIEEAMFQPQDGILFSERSGLALEVTLSFMPPFSKGVVRLLERGANKTEKKRKINFEDYKIISEFEFATMRVSSLSEQKEIDQMLHYVKKADRYKKRLTVH